MILPSTALIAESNTYRMTGRVSWDDGSCLLAFPGITLESKFTGTERIDLEAVLESGDEAYFNIWVNGHALEPLHVVAGKKSYNLVSQLNPEESYDLRLVKRTEAWQGKVRINKLAGDETVEWLTQEELPKRKLMTIGDSITCGSMNEVKEPFTREGHHSSNAEAAYGYVLAKLLNAQLHQVSYGGKGLIRDYQGLESEVTAPQFFERIDPDDPESVWDHRLYIPEAVIVCLGQNDFNAGIIAESVYVSRYITFCKRILEVYPGAKILLVSSPIHGLQDPKRLALQAYIKLVSDHFEKEGIHLVRSFNSNEYAGTSLDAHPTVEQHEMLANDMLPVVSDWLGWKD